jgi:DNA-binding transcriptional MocR family regulator
MVQSSVVVVLFAVAESDDEWTLRSLADRLGVKHSKTLRALGRLAEAGLYDPARRRLIEPSVEEFLLHALRYLHPIAEGALTRGIPTAWGAAPLSDEIHSQEPPPVWPDPRGTFRGPAIEPLDDSLPRLSKEWPEVAQLAALADGLRIGDARTRSAAERLLLDKLRAPA